MTSTAYPIIERSQDQGAVRRTAYGVFTALAWFAYMYLWLPLLTLLAWLLGIRTTYTELFLRDHAIDPFIAIALPLIALGCALSLIGWAEYNRLRFQGREKRRAPDTASRHEVDTTLGAEPALAARLRDARIATVALDAASQPTTVNVRQ